MRLDNCSDITIVTKSINFERLPCQEQIKQLKMTLQKNILKYKYNCLLFTINIYIIFQYTIKAVLFKYFYIYIIYNLKIKQCSYTLQGMHFSVFYQK